MDWISHFLQTLQALFQSVTALLVAAATLVTGITAFIGLRARLRSHRDKSSRTNSIALSKVKESNKVASVQPLLSPPVSPPPTTHLDKPYMELEQQVDQPSETHPTPSNQRDPQLAAAQSVLKAVSGLTELAHNMAEQCRRSSKSGSPYRNQLILLEALAAALPDLQRLARTLDGGLNKLDIVWDGEDPRRVLFWYVDPFTPFPTQRSAEGMRTTFIEEAERIVAAIEGLGYRVEKKKHRWDKRMPLSYVLAKSQEITTEEA